MNFSKPPSNLSNSCSKFKSLSIKSTKLTRDLQPILESLGQFLFTKINLSRFYDCKQHLLKLIRILVNENNFFVFIWHPIIHKTCCTKTNYRKHALMFFPPLHWTFDVFNIHLIMLENQKLFIDQLHGWFTCVGCHLKDIQIHVFFNLLINNAPFIFNQWMQMIITF